MWVRNAKVNSGPALAGGGIARKSVAFEAAIGGNTGHTQGMTHLCDVVVRACVSHHEECATAQVCDSVVTRDTMRNVGIARVVRQ